MRILFLSSWLPFPPDNGSKIRVFYLLKALSGRHDVDLVAFEFGTDKRLPHVDADAMLRRVDTVPVDPFQANQIHAIRRFLSPIPVIVRPIERMADLVRDRLAAEKFDIIIASGELMSSYALQNRVGTAIALEIHNSMGRWMWERYDQATAAVRKTQYWISWQKTKHYERSLFSKFDLVTMVSEQDRSFSEQHVHHEDARVEVVPNGVDCERNRPGIMDEVPGRLVYPGALAYSANFDAMVYFLGEIYPRIRSEVPEATLVITGSTEGVDVSGLATDNSVSFTGYVDDVRREISQASVVVTPIRQGGGTRLKILEAMALGRPVVSTRKGAEGLDVASGSDLLLADDPAQFAWYTIGLLRDRTWRQGLAEAGRRLVAERYDWRPIGHDFVRLVEEAVAQRSGN